MDRATRVGMEYLRHQKEIEDIKIFFDYIESIHIVDSGDVFMLPGSADTAFCNYIDWLNLTLGYYYLDGNSERRGFELTTEDMK